MPPRTTPGEEASTTGGFLLDVNVVIALLDASHVHHDRAHTWFGDEGKRLWFSCPLVENGAVRIVSHPRYPNPSPPPTVMTSLKSLLGVGDHRFLPDRLSLLDASHFRQDAILSAGQVTDTYLVALASVEGAALATFDRKLVTTAIVGEKARIFQIP
jgi:toxin-antitoxin system PIN domain toxin